MVKGASRRINVKYSSSFVHTVVIVIAASLISAASSAWLVASYRRNKGGGDVDIDRSPPPESVQVQAPVPVVVRVVRDHPVAMMMTTTTPDRIRSDPIAPFPQIGYLTPEGGWKDEGEGCPVDALLPLHGGPSPTRRDRYHYFALWSGPVGAAAPIRVPVHAPVADHGNRDDPATRRVSCMGDVGCGQLFDGDLVSVPDASHRGCRWRVRLY